MRTFAAIIVFVATALGFLVVGCGGGEDSAGAEQIDKATFVKRANAICKTESGKMAAQLAAITKRESAKPNFDFTAAQVTVVKEALIPGLETELKEIEALGVPDEAKKETTALLAAYRKSIDTTKAKTKWVAEGASSFENVELAGTRFGISECPVAAVLSS